MSDEQLQQVLAGVAEKKCNKNYMTGLDLYSDILPTVVR